MELKTRVLRLAAQSFLRYGIKRVRMDDLACALAISKKTLYKVFATKDELVQEVVTDCWAMLEDDYKWAAMHAGNAVELLTQHVGWADQQLCHLCLHAMRDLKKYYPTIWERMQAHKNNFVLAQLMKCLRWGIAEHLFRPDLDVEVLARLRLSQFGLLVDFDRYPSTSFTTLRLNKALSEHFLLGIVTPHGQRLLTMYCAAY